MGSRLQQTPDLAKVHLISNLMCVDQDLLLEHWLLVEIYAGSLVCLFQSELNFKVCNLYSTYHYFHGTLHICCDCMPLPLLKAWSMVVLGVCQTLVVKLKSVTELPLPGLRAPLNVGTANSRPGGETTSRAISTVVIGY